MLTDNEKTVTVEHVAGIAVRHPDIVAVSRHYGMTVKTCLPADPVSKGGSENAVKIAKADVVLASWRTLASANQKLTVSPQLDNPVLTDLVEDPFEHANVAAEQPERLETLLALLRGTIGEYPRDGESRLAAS